MNSQKRVHSSEATHPVPKAFPKIGCNESELRAFQVLRRTLLSWKNPFRADEKRVYRTKESRYTKLSHIFYDAKRASD